MVAEERATESAKRMLHRSMCKRISQRVLRLRRRVCLVMCTPGNDAAKRRDATHFQSGL